MNRDTPEPKLAPARQPAEPRVGVAPRTVLVTSEQLFAGAAEVQIDHHGARYRLKRTSLGKLILTK
jgi:hemin uptake protein HemP